MNECNPNPCENGANCTVGQLGLLFNYEHVLTLVMFICRLLLVIDTAVPALLDMLADNCQINVGVQECQLAPCINGFTGTCHNITNGYTCECRQGYEAS